MNESTAGSRAWFASHRQRIEALLRRGPKGGRLCVLGAGNCNDLDLPELAGHFGEIHLVDLDEAAARGATKLLGLTNVVVHAPVDITGIAAIISTWGMPRPTDAAIANAMQLTESGTGLGGVLREVENTFDIVLSPCVLSQLIVSARDALGYQHPRYPEVRRSIQLGHARLMTRLLRPGGRAMLLVDAVSSERADRVAQLESHETREALATWIERGLHFPGLEPATVLSAVREAAPGATVELDTGQPWVWRLGERKAFVVYACQWSVGTVQAYP